LIDKLDKKTDYISVLVNALKVTLYTDCLHMCDVVVFLFAGNYK